MKLHHFIAGFAAGAAVSALVLKKVSCCKSSKEGESLAQANATIDSLRSSVDCFSKQLSERIQSEQTYAASCDDLKKQLSAKEEEIHQLKEMCAIQEAQNKKLEAGA